MAKSSRADLKADQAVKWANNTTKSITPQRLRQPMIDCVDSFPNIVDDGRTVVRENVADMLSYDWSDVDTGTAVKWLGYYDTGDNGGRKGYVDKADTTTAHNGITVFVAADGTRIKALDTSFITSRQAGAKGDGSTDDTARIQAGLDFASSAGAAFVLSFSVYCVSKLTWTANRGLVISQGATIKGVASSAQNSILEITNTIFSDIRGKLTIDANSNTDYATGMFVRASTTTSRLCVSGVTFLSAKLGLQVGEYNIDAHCSEIEFNDCHWNSCPQAAYVAGSQTGVSFVGCDIISEPNAAFSGDEYVLKQEGGFVTIVGGSCVAGVPSVNTYGFMMHPASTVTYANQYPLLRVTGSHIEMGGGIVLLTISNPRSLSSPTSAGSSFASLTGCGGYVGSGINANLIVISDTTFAGALQVKNCSFYAGNVTRNANTIDATGNKAVQIEVDKTSFGQGFKDWIGGVAGGILRHENLEVFKATDLSGLTINSGAGPNNATFATAISTGSYARYVTLYNPANGAFLVPPGGARRVSVRASCVATASTPSLIGIFLNGTKIFTGSISGSVMNVSGSFNDLVENDQVDVRITNTAGVTMTFGSSLGDSLSIEIGN